MDVVCLYSQEREHVIWLFRYDLLQEFQEDEMDLLVCQVLQGDAQAGHQSVCAAHGWGPAVTCRAQAHLLRRGVRAGHSYVQVFRRARDCDLI